MNRVIEKPQGFKDLINQFKDYMEPLTYGYTLGSNCNWLGMSDKQIPDYLREAIKRDYVKDIEEFRIDWDSISLTVIFTYKDGSEEEFTTYKLGNLKNEGPHGARILEWMMNIKYQEELNDSSTI